MARGVNKVILIGNLGRDPELSYLPSGTAVARLSVATTEGRKNAEGNWEDVTEWHRVSVFGKTAETAGQYMSKGQQVYIEGKITYGSYEKDGIKRYTTDIIAFKVQLLGRREDSGQRDDQSRYQPEPTTPPQPPNEHEPPGGDIEDDLPF